MSIHQRQLRQVVDPTLLNSEGGCSSFDQSGSPSISTMKGIVTDVFFVIVRT